jgi:hypothetical protein
MSKEFNGALIKGAVEAAAKLSNVGLEEKFSW